VSERSNNFTAEWVPVSAEGQTAFYEMPERNLFTSANVCFQQKNSFKLDDRAALYYFYMRI